MHARKTAEITAHVMEVVGGSSVQPGGVEASIMVRRAGEDGDSKKGVGSDDRSGDVSERADRRRQSKLPLWWPAELVSGWRGASMYLTVYEFSHRAAAPAARMHCKAA